MKKLPVSTRRRLQPLDELDVSAPHLSTAAGCVCDDCAGFPVRISERERLSRDTIERALGLNEVYDEIDAFAEFVRPWKLATLADVMR